MSGAEVVQVYVRPLSGSVHRPDRELRAFAKREGLELELHPRLRPLALALGHWGQSRTALSTEDIED